MDKALKSLGQRGVRNITLVLVELARGKKAPRRNKHLMELVDYAGLADPGISGNEHQLRRSARYHALKGGKQGIDLPLAPVQFLRNQEAVWCVVFAQGEFVDAALSFPCLKAAPQITL